MLEQLLNELNNLASMPTEVPTQTSLELTQPKQKSWFQRLFKRAGVDLKVLSNMQKLAGMLLNTWESNFVIPFTKTKNLETVCKLYSQIPLLQEGLLDLKDSMIEKDDNGLLLHSYVDDSHEIKVLEKALIKFDSMNPQHWDILYKMIHKFVLRFSIKFKGLLSRQ